MFATLSFFFCNSWISTSFRLLWCWHQSGVHGGGAVRAAPPVPTDLWNLPEASAGRFLNLCQQLRLCGSHQEDEAGVAALHCLSSQTSVPCCSTPAGHRPPSHPGSPAEAVSSRWAGNEEKEGARWVKVQSRRLYCWGPFFHLINVTSVVCMQDLTSGVLDDGLMSGEEEGTTTCSISAPSTSRTKNFLYFAR